MGIISSIRKGLSELSDLNREEKMLKSKLRDLKKQRSKRNNMPVIHGTMGAASYPIPTILLSIMKKLGFNKNTNNVDKIIDSVYNASHVGGSRYHRLLDGNHTIIGAMKAAEPQNVQETMQVMGHLIKDGTTVRGGNLIFSLTKEQFNGLAGALGHFGISKEYLYNLITSNLAEVGGGLIAGTVAALFSTDSLDLIESAGALMAYGFAQANPILLAVALALIIAYFATTTKEERTYEALARFFIGVIVALVASAVILGLAYFEAPLILVLAASIVIPMVTRVLLIKSLEYYKSKKSVSDSDNQLLIEKRQAQVV